MPSTPQGPRQISLFGNSEAKSKSNSNACEVVAVGKRRDGGTRYWCLRHRADATAKYGKPSIACRYALVAPVTSKETLQLQLEEYPGGVALWGAVPPVYDTTKSALDQGIHVHARKTATGKKQIDKTFRAVRLHHRTKLSKDGVSISELDAIYFMVSSVFGFPMKSVACTRCGYSHLDKDWFSVHPHRGHLCSGCGRHFKDVELGIGNPICAVQEALQLKPRPAKPAKRRLNIKQRDFPGGLQIWGSNASIVWTGDKDEEEGIHVHAFTSDSPDGEPELDDTFSEVSIDGIALDATLVRTMMAQQGLPHVEERVTTLDCEKCGRPHFSTGTAAFTPATEHRCHYCLATFPSRGRIRNVISNPMVRLRGELAQYAPRPPQKHDSGLLPETL